MTTRNLFRIMFLLCIGALLYLIFILFWPTHFDVPVRQARTTTQYWQLTTGSRIAYTLLKGNSRRDNHPPLVYLHGGPGAGITDREIATYKSLAEKGYDVYLYDQVGCGFSGRLDNIAEYTAERHRHDLEEIIKKISEETGSATVVLVGQSWGSILAVDFVAYRPHIVEKLIITAPAPIQPAKKEWEQVKPPDSLSLRSPQAMHVKKRRTPPLRQQLALYLARKYQFRLMSDREADEFATWQTDELNQQMVCDTAHAVRAESTEGLYAQFMTARSIRRMKDQRKFLQQLNTPVLVMKAQCDNQPWGYTAEYLRIFPEAQLKLIRNAGHNIFIEQPGAYIDAIVSFLEKD